MEEASTGIDPLMLLFADQAVANDPAEAYARLLTECPVARTPGMLGDEKTVWMSSYEAAMWALKHPEVFSSKAEAINIGQKHDLIPLQIDPPLHTKYRRMLSEWFAPRAINPLEGEIRRLANQLIDGFIDRGSCDYHEEFATPFPSTVFLAHMGLPQSDLDQLLIWRDDIIRPAVDPEEAEAVRERTGAAITAYFEAAIRDVRENPREGFWSDLVNAEFSEFDNRQLTDDELLGLAFLFMLGGLDTVTATLDCMLEYLAQHPERRRQLVDHPELAPDAVEEMMRAMTPVQVVLRVVARDGEYGGVQFKAGDKATIVLGAGNHDPQHFEKAADVDFERAKGVHLAFGGGPHLCLGINLARLELRVALEEWHKRIPDYEIAPGARIRHSPGIRQTDDLPLTW